MSEYIEVILAISGSATCLMVLQFAMPRLYLRRVLNIDPDSDALVFYAGHWACLATVIGILLLLSINNLALRETAIWVAMVEKGILAIWILKDRAKPYARRIVPAAIFDLLNAGLFAAYLASSS